MSQRNRIRKLAVAAGANRHALPEFIVYWFYEPGAFGPARTGRATARVLRTRELIHKEQAETDEQFLSRLENIVANTDTKACQNTPNAIHEAEQ